MATSEHERAHPTLAISSTVRNTIEHMFHKPLKLRSGGPKLKQTQTYPPEFGKKVAGYHLKFMVGDLAYHPGSCLC